MSEHSTWRACAEMIKAVLDGARVDDQDRETVITAIGANLIASEEQKKPCAACGQSVHNFNYWRVTAAGRFLVQALDDDASPAALNPTPERTNDDR